MEPLKAMNEVEIREVSRIWGKRQGTEEIKVRNLYGDGFEWKTIKWTDGLQVLRDQTYLRAIEFKFFDIPYLDISFDTWILILIVFDHQFFFWHMK